jgi:hypothetical protein
MKQEKSLLICMTPVRNEAWVLHAFLKATSLWADYIIIADQMSTDGSREIALSYPKVILIDNNDPNFNEANRQKLLIDKAREIKGDKILFGLDADEVFSSNFAETNDWSKILNSIQGDVFWFRWANISSNQKEYWTPNTSFPWMFHDDGKEPHGNYVRNIHSMRIPYPIHESQIHYVNDFKVMHLAYLYPERVESKLRFYKFVDFELNKRSCVTLSRNYCSGEDENILFQLSNEWTYSNINDTLNVFSLVDLRTKKFWFDEYIVERIKCNGVGLFRKLDIWDASFLIEYNLKDPRSIYLKLIHLYLNKTRGQSNNIFTKIIDNILKKSGF